MRACARRPASDKTVGGQERPCADNLLILHTMISLQRATNPREKVYCCFVDFLPAYDSIPRAQLCDKLRELGVKGIALLHATAAAAACLPATAQELKPLQRCLHWAAALARSRA